MNSLDHLLVSDLSEADFEFEVWQRLTSCANDVSLVDRQSPRFETLLPDADGLLLNVGTGVDAADLARAPKLKYVGIFATGYGKIDTGRAASQGVLVTNVPDYSTQSVAELVLAAGLIVYRNLLGEAARARSGDFSETSFAGRDLRALRVGILGAGAIGRRTAALFSSLGSTVSYWSRTRRSDLDEAGVLYLESPEAVASSSDLLSIHLASNSDTENLVSASVVDALPTGGTIINTAPNEVIDLARVLRRCKAGELNFVMDHADELESESQAKELTETPNVTVLPPIGYATREASLRKQEILVGNLEQFLAGTATNVVG